MNVAITALAETLAGADRCALPMQRRANTPNCRSKIADVRRFLCPVRAPFSRIRSGMAPILAAGKKDSAHTVRNGVTPKDSGAMNTCLDDARTDRVDAFACGRNSRCACACVPVH
jgi:hypothetical protein